MLLGGRSFGIYFIKNYDFFFYFVICIYDIRKFCLLKMYLFLYKIIGFVKNMILVRNSNFYVCIYFRFLVIVSMCIVKIRDMF